MGKLILVAAPHITKEYSMRYHFVIFFSFTRKTLLLPDGSSAKVDNNLDSGTDAELSVSEKMVD